MPTEAQPAAAPASTIKLEVGEGVVRTLLDAYARHTLARVAAQKQIVDDALNKILPLLPLILSSLPWKSRGQTKAKKPRLDPDVAALLRTMTADQATSFLESNTLVLTETQSLLLMDLLAKYAPREGDADFVDFSEADAASAGGGGGTATEDDAAGGGTPDP